jgi:hypothetical protein
MTLDYDYEKGCCHPENEGAIKYCLDEYRRVIYFVLFLAVAGGITAVVVVNSGKAVTTTNACEGYTQDSLASSITKECLQFIWKNANCKPVSDFPSWWTSSPQGGKTILCDPYRPDYPCGAGNYQAIVNGMAFCKIDYKGR